MDTDLKPLIDLLSGQFGWIATVIVWVGAFRLAMKPVSAALQSVVSLLLSFVADTPETDDDALVLKILQSRTYRVIAFFVDWVASVKLPTSKTVKGLKE
jgi:hypothetical protein